MEISASQNNDHFFNKLSLTSLKLLELRVISIKIYFARVELLPTFVYHWLGANLGK